PGKRRSEGVMRCGPMSAMLRTVKPLEVLISQPEAVKLFLHSRHLGTLALHPRLGLLILGIAQIKLARRNGLNLDERFRTLKGAFGYLLLCHCLLKPTQHGLVLADRLSEFDVVVNEQRLPLLHPVT